MNKYINMRWDQYAPPHIYICNRRTYRASILQEGV